MPIANHCCEGAERAAKRAHLARRGVDRVHHREIEPYLGHRTGLVQADGGGTEANVRLPVLETKIDGGLA